MWWSLGWHGKDLKKKCSEGEGEHEQDYWNRLGNNELGGVGDAGWRTGGDPEPGRHAHDAFGGGDHEDGGATGGPSGETPGGDQSGEHHLFDQALHGAALRRSARRDEAGALQSSEGSA